MSTELQSLEDELRAAFATVAPPTAPLVSLDAARSVPSLPRRGTVRHIVLPRVALLAAAGVVVAAFMARQQPATPRPPSRAATLAVAVLPAGSALNCTIAVSALSDVHATGFITFTRGVAAFHRVTTTGNTYVAGLHRWVQTTPQMVSPRGDAFVTTSGDPAATAIQVVDSTGTHTLLTAANLQPLGFAPEGIVLLDASPTSNGPNQAMPLSLLDPRTGARRNLPLPHYPQLSLPGANASSTGYQGGTNSVWMTSADNAGTVSVLSRYDLTNGATTVWWDGRIDGPGFVQQVAETSAGEPIVQVAAADLQHVAPAHRHGIVQRTLLLTSPHHAALLNGGPVGRPGVADNFSPLSAIDGSTVWLAADDGTLWQYRPVLGLRAMAAIRTSTSGAPGVSISGPCV